MPPKRLFLDQRLYVRLSTIPNAGKGLFTNKPIPAGALIGEYKGTILPLSAMYDTSADRDYYVQTLTVPGYPAAIIDGKTMDNKMRWINDPRYDKPRLNAKMVQGLHGKVYVRAIRHIKAGEEILMAYEEDYWKAEEQAALNKWLDY
jgi:SET domain-containing protein